MSLILLAKFRDFKRLRRYGLRKTTAPIRIKINNLVSELHKHTANYLYQFHKIVLQLVEVHLAI